MEETQTAPQTEQRPDSYTLITGKIIEQLEKGLVPWQKPWTDSGIPMNLITKRVYHGINLFLLAMEEYEHNLFLTFEQVNKIGGKVRRGAKGHILVYWKKEEQEVAQDEAKKAEKPRAILRHFTVFNIAQCENIPASYLPTGREIKELPSCDQIVKSMPNCPKIQHKEQKAYYEVVEDLVNMPKRKSFTNDAAYYSTLFHELVHSTGHDSRLARPGVVEMAEFAGEMYSKEELVAEFGTCYLLSHAGITTEFKNSTAYIQGWLKKLKDDKRIVLFAAREAQKAAEYILGIKEESGPRDE